VLYVGIVIWAFAERSILRLALVITALAWGDLPWLIAWLPEMEATFRASMN